VMHRKFSVDDEDIPDGKRGPSLAGSGCWVGVLVGVLGLSLRLYG
jgi:hypothetical protein